MPRGELVALLVAVGALVSPILGCVEKTEATSASTGPGASSAVGSSTGSSGASTTGPTAVSSSATSGSSGSSTGSASSSSSGTTTGHIPVYVDGGYVFCASEQDIDGGEAPTAWMCQPGTYFCGAPTSCSQCRSDVDCADQNLPTYDPLRQRCDLDSGVSGYWGFCQECLGSADCINDGIDNQCDLDPNSEGPSIETQGFETCANLGPGCPYGTLAGIGGCSATRCQTDADCAGAISVFDPGIGMAQEAEPYCISGRCVPFPATLPGYFCPNCFCYQDAVCYDGISTCDQSTDHCGCTSSVQCGGPWPICELADAGFTDDAGELVGFCGCEIDADCGDAGLRCLELDPNDELNLYGGKTCLFSCTDPRFPGCASLSATTPICDAPTGLCIPCEIDQQCRTLATGTSVGPFCRLDGQCGCQVDTDCPDHEICGGGGIRSAAGGTIFECQAPPLACNPYKCRSSGSVCDWDSGACVLPTSELRPCYTDFDCGTEAFCVPDAGGCVECKNNADCVTIGQAARSNGICLDGQCTPGCVRDADCATSYAGHTCDTDSSTPGFGTCICQSASECGFSYACRAYDGQSPQCTNCVTDSDCPSGRFCTPFGLCQPRCDDAGAGCQPTYPLCDTSNVRGQNGAGSAGADSGAIWCYGCLSASDCPADLACSDYGCSGECFDDAQCHAGEVCGDEFDNTCHVSCDAGACPTGVCDRAGHVIPIPDLCYQCLSPSDCADGTGCNSRTHTCGSCLGPTTFGAPFDCGPDAICSTYWVGEYNLSGVCLQNCDDVPCADSSKTCSLFPNLTTFHKYCFACLTDSDCADAGAGAWCDTSVNRTFTCQPAVTP